LGKRTFENNLKPEGGGARMANKRYKRKSISVNVGPATLVEQIHNYWIDLKHRQLWIHGVDMNNDTGYQGLEPGVEYMMATKVIKNLHIFRQQSTSERVIIHLHTCGGSYTEGMAIYDAIKAMPYPVTIISYTHARSMSSIIFQAGNTRLMLPHSYFLFHLGTLEVGGEARTVHSNVDFAKMEEQAMIDIYVDKARKGLKFKGWTKDRIRALINREMEKKSDVFLTPQEAIDWGFADGILTTWPN